MIDSLFGFGEFTDAYFGSLTGIGVGVEVETTGGVGQLPSGRVVDGAL